MQVYFHDIPLVFFLELLLVNILKVFHELQFIFLECINNGQSVISVSVLRRNQNINVIKNASGGAAGEKPGRASIVKYRRHALCHSAKPCYNLVLGGCSSAG
ncbi:hypothetical protein [Janthinobacterium sp. FW305-128]|uniref:hypothetical protein n=1 Tax=Janthinobacterium sp. FW305-128 TaxID=2775055 RepID=UPI001E47D874|nr:hypothetical protein [Janthinobacterium sp. FW305-128]MCC7681732.1 hypothetical protein [Janthinobacterium sp. FW305-128]